MRTRCSVAAEALSRRFSLRPADSPIDPGDGYGGNRSAVAAAAIDRGGSKIEIDLAAQVPVSASVAASRCMHYGGCSMCWSGDDLGSSGLRVWLAVGPITDMRRGMNGLALQVQERRRIPMQAISLFSEAPVAI